MELRNALNAAFGVELPATAILDYPTVEALSGHIAGLAASAPAVMGAGAVIHVGIYGVPMAEARL